MLNVLVSIILINYMFLEAISSFKHDAKLQKNSSIKTNASYSCQSSVFSSNNSSQATSTPHANNTNNTIIYIKDPNNKNADIQHVNFNFYKINSDFLCLNLLLI